MRENLGERSLDGQGMVYSGTPETPLAGTFPGIGFGRHTYENHSIAFLA
jgi:hypothetical protein